MYGQARNACLVCLCFSTMVATAHPQGGPPMITDDPETPGDGKWEINLGWTLERSRHERLQEAPHLDINYGLGEHTQLKYEVSWEVLQKDHGEPRGGLSNSLIGWKQRFLDEDQCGFAMSVYPQLGFNNPTSSVRRGIAAKGADLLLPVEVAKTFGSLKLGAEAGYHFVSHGPDEWVYGLAGAYRVRNGVEVAGELHGTAHSDLTHHEPLVNLGTRVQLSKRVTLLLAVGRGLRHTAESPRLLTYFGFQFQF